MLSLSCARQTSTIDDSVTSLLELNYSSGILSSKKFPSVRTTQSGSYITIDVAM